MWHEQLGVSIPISEFNRYEITVCVLKRSESSCEVRLTGERQVRLSLFGALNLSFSSSLGDFSKDRLHFRIDGNMRLRKSVDLITRPMIYGIGIPAAHAKWK